MGNSSRIWQEAGKSILDICNSNSVHELMNFCATSEDASCPSADAIRCLATTFLESHAALEGKLGQLAKHHGEAGLALAQCVERVRKFFRCLSHLLSAPAVGTPTTAAEVLYFSSYQGRATFERGVRITLTKKKKVAETEDEMPGFWQKLIDEAIRTAASSVQLRPLYDQATAKLAEGNIFDNQAGASWLVESLSKLKSGMRAADLEDLLAGAQEQMMKKVEAIKEAHVADVSTAVVEALKVGLKMFEKEPGVLDCLQTLETWMSDNIHEISAGRFAVLAKKVFDTQKLDVDELTSALKRCKRGKTTAESSEIVEGFCATCYKLLVEAVVEKKETQQHVSKVLGLVDKSVNLHYPETSLVKQFAIAASALLKAAKEAVDALDQLDKLATSPEARLRKDRDMKLMQHVTKCLSDLLEKQHDMGKFGRDRQDEMTQHPVLQNIAWSDFTGLEENDTYQACLLFKMQAVLKDMDTKAGECVVLCAGYEQGGQKEWTADFTAESTLDELVKGTDKTLKILPSKAMSAACEALSEDAFRS